MSCELLNRDQRIDDFLLARLSPAEAEALEIHVFGCAACLDELRLREQMLALIKEERVTAKAAARTRSQPANWIRRGNDFFYLRPNAWIYAGAAAVLLVGIVTTYMFRHAPISGKYTMNFIPSSQLESMVGQAQRSADFKVAVISPPLEENLAGHILFRWTVTKDGQTLGRPLDLTIMNNKGAPIHNIKNQRGEYLLKEKMSPGLYYWSLQDHEETIYLGKIFVNKPKL